jgi:DNA-binding transcriptional regulator YdaS (Cro superfamily)
MDLKTYITESPRGTAAKLALELGVSASYLSQMAHGQAPISPDRAVEIEQKTDGQVTREELYPNDWQRFWPELVKKSDRRRSTDPVT